MKSKSAYLADQLAEDIDRIAETNRMSASQILGIAADRLVQEVKKTGKLPLPSVAFEEEPAATAGA